MEPDRFVTAEQDTYQTPQVRLFDRSYRELQIATGKLVPARKALTPRSARAFLPYLVIMEFIEPETVTVRLVGTAIVNRTHMGLTGKNLLDLYHDEGRDWALRNTRHVLDTPCGSSFYSTERYENSSWFTECLIFPFADQSGLVKFVIGVSVETDQNQLLLAGDSKACRSSIAAVS